MGGLAGELGLGLGLDFDLGFDMDWGLSTKIQRKQTMEKLLIARKSITKISKSYEFKALRNPSKYNQFPRNTTRINSRAQLQGGRERKGKGKNGGWLKLSWIRRF